MNSTNKPRFTVKETDNCYIISRAQVGVCNFHVMHKKDMPYPLVVIADKRAQLCEWLEEDGSSSIWSHAIARFDLLFAEYI